MANFKTHLFVASGISGVAALACMKAGIASSLETPMLLSLGAFGGLLPDIDSDHSVPIKISFNLLAFTLAFIIMFVFIGRYTVLELILIWLIVFIFVRWFVLGLFIKLTTHRGAIHSVLAAVFFALSTVSIAHHLFDKPYNIAWLYGAFVGFGFIIHLLLDEMFSVDLFNQRLKSSFGSALKIVSIKYWRSTLILMALTLFVSSTISYPSGFYTSIWHSLTVRYSNHKPWLIPEKGHWFNNMFGLLGQTFKQP